jgi:uncharacterized protein (TIGR04141 family)
MSKRDRATPTRVRQLTVYLLRRGEFGSPDDALDLSGDTVVERVALRRGLPFDATLFVRRPPGHGPWWQGFLSAGAAQELRVQLRSAGAILFVRAHGDLVAFTFGTGRFLLNPSSYERDFGLRVTLNTVDPRSLRSVDMQTVEDQTLLTSRQASRSSGLEVFQFDAIRDILRGVVGTPRDPEIALTMAGSDRLAFRARVSFGDLGAKCDQLMAAYSAKDYQRDFGFIDHMRRVAEPDLRADLDARTLDALNHRALEHLYLAPPDVVRWEEFDGYRYEPLEREGSREDLDAGEFLDLFGQARDRPLELDDLRRKVRVVAVAAATGDALHHWSLYDSVIHELELGDQRYVLSGGDWYEVEKTFAAETARQIGELPVCELTFPSSLPKETEPDYLARAGPGLEQSEGYRFFIFDRKLVRCEGAPSQMEVCDLLSELGHIVHVKRRTASSTLSHLFNQGTASATALMNDRVFRTAARARAQADHWDPGTLFPDDTPDAREYQLVYAVIAPGNAPLAEILPFLSQVNLVHAARLLHTMGFRVELAHIEEQ